MNTKLKTMISTICFVAFILNIESRLPPLQAASVQVE